MVCPVGQKHRMCPETRIPWRQLRKPDIKVQHTLVRYFRINESETGQFERTLIVVEEGAHVSYLEGCTAPPSPATRAIWAYSSK